MRRKTTISMVALALLGGCATTNHEQEKDIPEEELKAYLKDKPDSLKPYYEVLMKQGKRNAVLNQMRIGHIAINKGLYDTAEKAFDAAITNIETVYANSESAEKARSKFVEEDYKDFKGAPYERAMAYLYRGLLYLKEDDYENARAMFKGGQLQDALAGDKKYAADFASLEFLEGWASMCNGDEDLAEQSFSEAISLNEELEYPKEGDEELYVWGWDVGPKKYAKGKHNHKLAYARSSLFGDPKNGEFKTDMQLEFRRGDKELELIQAEDLYRQATTRGVRKAGEIVASKAEFKEGTKAASQALAAGAMSASTSTDQAAGYAGAAMAAGALIAAAMSAGASPEADTRFWDTLPGYIYLATAPQWPAPKAGTTEKRIVEDENGGRLVETYGQYEGTQVLPVGLTIPKRLQGESRPAEGEEWSWTVRYKYDTSRDKVKSVFERADYRSTSWLSQEEVMDLAVDADSEKDPCDLTLAMGPGVSNPGKRAPNSSAKAPEFPSE